YEAAVRRVLEYIRAGDVFQVNLAHRLTASFDGSARECFACLLDAMGPWCAAYVESPSHGRAAISLSPELFLQYDPRDRRVATRPIKGTRPLDESNRAIRDLLASAKDQAELVMIVDLMRNDLGRVCDFGTVRVVEPRAIETHGGLGPHRGSAVAHAVATIEGRLRQGLTVADLIAASFPPGSITGAPKIRAMQIIDELEPVRRALYTGSLGWLGDDGAALLNVAIRTAMVSADSSVPHPRRDHIEGTIDYSVGAGIVADSDPAAEYEETMHKAAGFISALAPEPAHSS
ncbi:MAG: anthranilate synthase component I family protein, partial [Planctomycetota bacterium]|nr:anthranilate synthase component I family protein [Planctomycetota bacterium]